jgi:hypothetical protein
METQKNSQDDGSPCLRTLFYGSTNIVFFVAGVASLVLGILAVLKNEPAMAGICLTAGLALLFAATIDRFESLKGLGIEAKTRQLDQKIVQADESLRQLREMTEISSAAFIELNSSIGRFSRPPSPRDSIALANRVREMMRNLGSDDTAICKVLSPWARTLCADMALLLVIDLRQLIGFYESKIQSQLEAIAQPIDADDQRYLKLLADRRLLGAFQQEQLRNFREFELEDFPDRFMKVFDEIPLLVDPEKVLPLRANAARFASGMKSLRDSKTLPEAELWIEELSKLPLHAGSLK